MSWEYSGGKEELCPKCRAYLCECGYLYTWREDPPQYEIEIQYEEPEEGDA
jgi:hypothetical protein